MVIQYCRPARLLKATHLRVDVEDTHAARLDDLAYRVELSAVVVVLEDSVLEETVLQDLLLHILWVHEVVVHTVYLIRVHRTGRVCSE